MTTVPTCAVTGAVAGDGGACGDCDPCIMGEAVVPEAVKRLIAAKNSMALRNGELEDDNNILRAALRAALPLIEIGLRHEIARFDAMHQPRDFSIAADIGKDRVRDIYRAVNTALCSGPEAARARGSGT